MGYGFFSRRRMQAKLTEADQNLEAANAKISQLEKVKLRMSQEMEDLVIEVERVSFIEKNIINQILQMLGSTNFIIKTWNIGLTDFLYLGQW